MSLKSFHIIFVTIAVALSFVTGYWGMERGTGSGMTIGLISSAIGISLIAYGVWFWRKISAGEAS